MLYDIDFYKVGHVHQYPKGTQRIYSNFTARQCIDESMFLGDKPYIVIHGIRAIVFEMIKQWDEQFFSQPVCVIEEYKDFVEKRLGLSNFDVSHLYQLHSIGKLPLEIRALDEGVKCPIGIPFLTIENTTDETFWLTNYVESALSANIWKLITTTTIASVLRELADRYAKKTCDDDLHVPYQFHDFSLRGMSSIEDARICGVGHLMYFDGSDNIPSIKHKNENGCSISATEHSVMCCNGVSGEFETIKRLITEVYPSGMVSIVLDSFDYWRALTEYLPLLKDIIVNRSGKVVIRPDSGNPIDIICGSLSGSEEEKRGSLNILWDIFGGTINSKGYKVLDDKIGLIYGDSITIHRANDILCKIESMGFASSNVVFGIGSYTYNYLTRDTFGMAMKATHAVINGNNVPIFKNPITGHAKKSAKGLLHVTDDLKLMENVTREVQQTGELKVIYYSCRGDCDRPR